MVHPVIRAILLHFWLAYDHPFIDGNGRTARALFYWATLRQGYWLFEFISISHILRAAPAKYARAFLYAESDHDDATYFILHQADAIHRAILALHEYIGQKSKGIKQSERMLRAWGEIKHRQVALLAHAMRHPGATYTVEGHQRSHMTVYETARRDLLELAAAALLEQVKRRKRLGFWPPNDLKARIEAHSAPSPARLPRQQQQAPLVSHNPRRQPFWMKNAYLPSPSSQPRRPRRRYPLRKPVARSFGPRCAVTGVHRVR